MRFRTWMAAPVALAVILTACGDDDGGGDGSTTPAEQACGTASGEGCAPLSARVDLEPPVFSDPTNITNPLFPVKQQQMVVVLGTADGEPFRAEIALLPDTRTIEWNGQQVEVLQIQYMAYEDGRLVETAIDWHAQADDGSVWYFGEDVFNYEGGVVANTNGTWLAGRDGPPGMIMPADPQEGDVYRPEPIPGLVFEEVTVKSVGETVEGPRGAVEGAIIVTELHMDGGTEDKTFAPGYGEFFTSSGGDEEEVAIGVPADSLNEELPSSLQEAAAAADAVFSAVSEDDWEAAAAGAAAIRTAWDAYKGEEVPPLLASQMEDALEVLDAAVEFQEPIDSQQAAIDVHRAVLDLHLQYRLPSDVDRDALDLLAKQVLVDAADNEETDVAGDVATMEWVLKRFQHTLEPSTLAEVEQTLLSLRTAAGDENLAAAESAAQRLRGILAGIQDP